MQQGSRNVILTGMMGAGKTTVGQVLSQILEYQFLDLDEIIEKKYGKISDIFSKHGEEYFRELETKELQNLFATEDLTPFVLSTGGGIVLKNSNIEILKNLGKVFYLSATGKTIYNRIKNQTHRPLLNTQNPKEAIEKILTARLGQYEKSGEKIVTDGKTTKQIAGEIYERIAR